MRESEVKKLYNSITNIKDEFAEEALTVNLAGKTFPYSPRGWAKWCAAAAACLCLAAGTFFMLKASKNPQTEMMAMESLDEVTASYDGNLLAEKLVASGATTNGISLSYAKGGDISDPGTWNTLSVTGDYNGQDFILECSFDGNEDTEDPSEVYAETRYGDVDVVIYRGEDGWSKPLYRAKFTLDGVAYDLSTHSDDPKEIYLYLDMVLGETEDSATQPGAVLTDVLGFGVCRIESEELTPFQYIWHYYVEVDGEDVCVAEQFGYDGPLAWSRDLDGDGVPELICICTYGDGVESAIVYRNNDGVIEEGYIKSSYYVEKFGWKNVEEGGIVNLPMESYDPERNVFTAKNYNLNGDDSPVTAEFNDGLAPFAFTPFMHTVD